MKCDRCKTEIAPENGAYRCCGIVTRLSDPGYIPPPGYSPSPYRVPAPEIFKPLPSEQGWEQGGSPELVLDEEDTPAQKAQAARRARETAEERAEERAEVARKGALTKAIAREARHAARESTRAVEAATRQRAMQGARTGAWYADRRAS